MPSRLIHLLALVAVLQIALPVSAAEQADADGGALNLLIIETDEHHFSTLGCYCGTIVETPVTTNNTPLDDSIVTFAEILGRNGYATGHASKRSSGISQLCDT